jgi:exodeoxyribonuclease-5
MSIKKIETPKALVDIASLNQDQKMAFNELRDFVYDRNNNGIYVIKGWAGTGKTYCVSLFVRYILGVVYTDKKWYKVAVTGPTNKSVRVIKKSTGLVSPRVNFSTIHKILGLRERITEDGRQEFVNEGNFRPAIEGYKLLIIDEVSMLSDELFHKIVKYRDRIKIICMGDPAQIPPVGKSDCIPFTDDLHEMYGIKTVELKTVMRQKNENPIIGASVAIRENLEIEKSPIECTNKFDKNGEGIEFLNLSLQEVRKSIPDILSTYFKTDRFQENPEYCKIIAWRNKTVSVMNSLVRRTIYGEKMIKNKILVGEKLIANDPIIEDDFILFNTNDEFTVEEIKIKTQTIKVDEISEKFKYYEARVSYIDDGEKKCYAYIDILHEDSEEDFVRFSNILKFRAIEKKGKEKSWIKYYKIMRRYANVNFAYCITCHKAQGSTYDISFVLEDDIDLNWDTLERNRIKYTAYTRASKKVYVLKRF